MKSIDLLLHSEGVSMKKIVCRSPDETVAEIHAAQLSRGGGENVQGN